MKTLAFLLLLVGCGQLDKEAVPALRDSLERERVDQEEITNLKAEIVRLKRDLSMKNLDNGYLGRQIAGLKAANQVCRAALEGLEKYATD